MPSDIDTAVVNTAVTADVPKLCGGTFFILVTRALSTRTRMRRSFGRDYEGITEAGCLRELIRIFDPGYIVPPASFKSDVTAYKQCQKSSSTYLPFEDKILIDSFSKEIKTTPEKCIDRMAAFCHVFIDPDKTEYLVKALLELLKTDPTIASDSVFLCGRNAAPVTVDALNNQSEYILPEFLLGIWHFIIMNRWDNTIGRTTYTSWFKSEGKYTRDVFISSIGRNSERRIRIVTAVRSTADSIEVIKNLEADTVAPPKADYTTYMKKVKTGNSSIKTLYYNDRPRPFYDFYVCNDVSQRTGYLRDGRFGSQIGESGIKKVDVERLMRYSTCIILTGPGGVGKSMMMRHLLLNAISEYSTLHLVPVPVTLKDFDGTYDTVFEYIYCQIMKSFPELNEEDFADDLYNGRFLLLFDGLDEIRTSLRKQFETKMADFTDTYSRNMFVITARPYSDFVYMSRFSLVELCPFNKEQALELIDKLEYYPEETKQKFRQELDTRLFYTHNEFIKNPLLLSIMLMTYERYADVPSKMHIFYRKAYSVLSEEHDSTKGAFRRSWRTGLSPERFADYFAEFCARTYRQEQFDFDMDDIARIFASMREPKKDPGENHITVSDFIDDLVNGVCLMYYDGGRYHFTHRSFQEYFCAVFFSRQKDRTLDSVGAMFESRGGRSRGDMTFSMLYDMIPESVEEYLFLPFLERLFAKYDAADGYITFLRTMYPTIYYQCGEVDEWTYNDPKSYIYKFIADDLNKGEYRNDLDLPPCEDFSDTEYVWVEDRPDSSQLIHIEDVPDEYVEENGYPEVVGTAYFFDVDDVLQNKETYKDIWESLNRDDFPLKAEYSSMRRYYESLKEKYDPKRSLPKDDFFAQFY